MMIPRTAAIVPHAVNIECANCKTPIYEGVIAADEIPWRLTVVCETCGNPARIPPSPFDAVFKGPNAVNGR
jgi:RNase P subunit RPR2